VLAGTSFSGDHGGAQAPFAPSIAMPIRNSAQCRPDTRSVQFDLRKHPQTTSGRPERRTNAMCQPPGCDPAGVKPHLYRNQGSALAQRARRVRQLERRESTPLRRLPVAVGRQGHLPRRWTGPLERSLRHNWLLLGGPAHSVRPCRPRSYRSAWGPRNPAVPTPLMGRVNQSGRTTSCGPRGCRCVIQSPPTSKRSCASIRLRRLWPTTRATRSKTRRVRGGSRNAGLTTGAGTRSDTGPSAGVVILRCSASAVSRS
jgi:hypothetical protein